MTPMDTVRAGGSRVDARVHGDVSGQIAVGNNILQNNVSHGGVVYVAAPGETPTVRRRPSPVELAGRAQPPLLGREAELEEVASALQFAGVIQICGPAGSGKTSLLKSVLHGPLRDTAADGVVYHNAVGDPVEDTLQAVFEAFYTSDLPFKPTDGDIRHALEPIRALLALDDVSQASDRIRQVLDAAPNALFVLASPRPVLAGGDPSLSLRGLEEDAALSVLERGIGRALTAHERPAARSIVRALEGQPLRLVQVAAVVKEVNWSLPALAREVDSGKPVEILAEKIFDSLSDDQRDVLALLAAMEQAPLYVDNVADLTGIAEVGPVVESLLVLALVQAHSPRFSLTAEVSKERRGELDVDRWRDRVLESLQEWVGRQDEPGAVVKETAAILHALDDGIARRAWPQVLRLGRTVETPLILGGRWGAWEAVLGNELRAARGLGDRTAEGWSLHQLGTRALCLGDTFTARVHLSEALRIRESLGDIDGAAATRHNLEFLSGPPPPPSPPEQPPPGPPGGWRSPARLGAAALVLLVVALAVASLGIATDGKQSIASVDLGGELRAEQIDFGDQEVGTTSDVFGARLANPGDEPIAIDAVTLTGKSPDDFAVSDDPCSRTAIAPGETCTVGILFRPTTIGTRQAALAVARGGGMLEVVLRGNGIAPAPAVDTTIRDSAPDPAPAPRFVLSADPSSLTVENQPLGTASAPTTVTVRNQGTAGVLLARVVVAGLNGGDFVVGDDRCAGHTLSPGASCGMTVTFRPTEPGTRSATLEVAPDGGPPLLVPLQGTSVPSADVRVMLGKPLPNDGETTVEVTVANDGPSPVPEAFLTVRGTGELEGVGVLKTDGMSCPEGPGSQIDCTVSELAANGTATLTLQLIGCGEVEVDVRVEANVPDLNDDNNSSKASVPCAVLLGGVDTLEPSGPDPGPS